MKKPSQFATPTDIILWANDQWVKVTDFLPPVDTGQDHVWRASISVFCWLEKEKRIVQGEYHHAERKWYSEDNVVIHPTHWRLLFNRPFD